MHVSNKKLRQEQDPLSWLTARKNSFHFLEVADSYSMKVFHTAAACVTNNLVLSLSGH